MQAIGVDIFCLNRIDLNKKHLIERIITKKLYEVFESVQSPQIESVYPHL